MDMDASIVFAQKVWALGEQQWSRGGVTITSARLVRPGRIGAPLKSLLIGDRSIQLGSLGTGCVSSNLLSVLSHFWIASVSSLKRMVRQWIDMDIVVGRR
jgi:hypothetical protein